MVAGGIALVVGIVLFAAAPTSGDALNALRVEGVRQSSLLSQAAKKRLQDVYRSPENQVLERRLVRIVGVLVALAGAVGLIHSLAA